MLKLFVLVLTLSMGTTILAHKGKSHAVVKSQAPAINANDKSVVEQINRNYRSTVKRLFERSCYDCHSQSTVYPWYYSVPFVRGMIDRDISEGLKHLDLSADFPFAGHGTPVEDLNAIRDAIESDTMPPTNYRFLHQNSTLREKDKKFILDWIRESLQALAK